MALNVIFFHHKQSRQESNRNICGLEEVPDKGRGHITCMINIHEKD